MKQYEIEVPISTVARVTVKSDNPTDAVILANQAVKNELHGGLGKPEGVERVYICDEYESFDVGDMDDFDIIDFEEC